MGIVQRQATISSIITLAGFFLGAINILFIFPKLMTPEQMGLTRLIMDAGQMIAAICSFGLIAVINKFFPYYNQYVPTRKNDLAGISLMLILFGFLLFVGVAYFYKDFIIRKFGGKSPLFIPYYYLLLPYVFFLLLFNWIESIGWGFKRSVLTNLFKETYVRLYTTVLLGLLAIGILEFSGFMNAFVYVMALPVMIIIIILTRQNKFGISFKPGSLTKRMKNPIRSFVGYAFFGTVLSMLIKTMDTFFLAGFSELSNVAIFTIATYLTMVMEIPFRSIVASATPIMAENWKNKDLENIRDIYSKSTLTLLFSGFFLFGCIWLNLHNFPKVLGTGYTIEKSVMLVLAIAKLIDLGTGINAHVIATSTKWRFEFFSTLTASIIAIFVNAWLIKNYGLLGAAYGTLISICMINLSRFIFLWAKFNLQPLGIKNLYLLIVAAICIFLISLIPELKGWLPDSILRCGSFTILYGVLVYKLNISDNINSLIRGALVKLRIMKGQ